MPKTRLQKEEVVKKLTDSFQTLKSLVFIDFTGVKTKEVEEFRNTVRGEGSEYLVVKKTLIDKAVKEAQSKGIALQGVEAGKLEGEIAVLMNASDEIAPMRQTEVFTRTHKQMKIRGGILDFKFLDPAQVLLYAKLPSKAELLAKLVGSFRAPLSGFVSVLQGNLRGLVQVLSKIKKA